MNENRQKSEEDTIDLRELWKTLVKGKVIIAVMTLSITLLAIIYALGKTPIYEVKSHVQIGFIGEKLIVDPHTVVKTLNILFNVEDKPSSKEDFVSEVSSIDVNKKISNFITVKTEAVSNEEGLKKNKEVTDFVIAKYKPTIEKYVLDINNQILNVKRQISKVKTVEIEDLKKQIEIKKSQKIAQIDEKIRFAEVDQTKSINNKIAFYSKNLKTYKSAIENLYEQNKNSTDQTNVMITSIQMVNYQNLILDAENKLENLKLELIKINNETIPNLKKEKDIVINDEIRKIQNQIDLTLQDKIITLEEQVKSLEYNLLPQNVQNSQVLGDYITYDYAVKPKKKPIVVVAFVTGLFLSIFLVFLLAFIREEKK